MQPDGKLGWVLGLGLLESKVFGVEPWLAATVGGVYVASSVDWPTAIAAIERELLAIRVAIPGPPLSPALHCANCQGLVNSLANGLCRNCEPLLSCVERTGA
jgi:hypothetical protein